VVLRHEYNEFGLPISKLRYDALAGCARRLGAYVLSKESAWSESPDGRVVGTLIRETSDDDFGGLIIGRDTSSALCTHWRCRDLVGSPTDRRLLRPEICP